MNGRSVPTAEAGFPVLRLTALGKSIVDLSERKIGDWTPDQAQKYLVRAGDFLIARGNGSLRLVGRGALVLRDDDVAFPDTMIRLRPAAEVLDSNFLRYQWDAHFVRAAIERAAKTTAGIYKISQNDLRELRLYLAPLPEQRRIVAEIEKQFTRLDAAEATLKRVQANLERARASVLKAAVEGRLVPTEAELARASGRDYEPASVLLERILAERERKHDEAQAGAKRNKKYKPPVAPDLDGLPELPEGWTWASVDQLYWDAGYGTSVKCDYDASGPPVLRIPNVQRGAISLDDIKRATDASKLKPDGEVRPGDFVFIRTNGSRNLIGRGALVVRELSETHFASYLIRIRLLGPVVTHRWVAMSWHGPNVRAQILAGAASSAGQFNVSLGNVKHLAVALPPLAEQQRILDESERRFTVLDASAGIVTRSLRRCASLRQSILKRAFEGKLVPQDPTDEPASELLARIQAQPA